MELNEIMDGLSVFGQDQPLPRAVLAEAALHQEELIPVLLEAMEHIYEEICSLDEDEIDDAYDDPSFDLYYYGLFLLAQFQEQQAFPKLLRIMKLDRERLEVMLGDMVCEMDDILYSTYNGDCPALKEIIADDTLDPFARASTANVLDGLLRDGRLSREDLVQFLRERLAALGDSEDEVTFGGLLISIIADNDLYELVEDVREAFRRERIDVYVLGDFDDFFDCLYNKKERPDHAHIIEDSARELETWSCFKKEETPKAAPGDLLSWKVGRNDPCPCGSGKKFKKCCLPKQEQLKLQRSRIPGIDENNYPSVEGEGDRPGLSEFYSQDAIRVDWLAYRAMYVFWNRRLPRRKEAQEVYAEAEKSLWNAFEEFRRVCEKEGIETPEDYDKEHKLHYYCRDWLEYLRDLLKDTHDQRYLEVQAVLSQNAG